MFNPITKIIDVYGSCVNNIKKRIYKFYEERAEKNMIEENIYLFLEHAVFYTIGFVFFFNEDWAYDITMMKEYSLSLKIIVYYILYIVRYIVQIKNLKNEKDYTSKLIHHISTISLLSLSLYHYHRIGVIVAFSHDAGDLFLLPAKICHKSYEVTKKKILNLLSYFLFSCFFLIFFSTRIVLNSKIIHYIYYNLWLPGEYLFLESYILFMLLFVNLSLQVFWQIMIVKFSYKLIKGEKPKDEKGNEYFKNE